MALIGTIRKNYWFVLILLGLALLAFILMDVMSNNNRTSVGGDTVGYVAGQKINQLDFNKTQSALFNNSGGDPNVSTNATWNYYTEKAVIDSESNQLGLGVSKEELMDLQFGANLSPIIQQNFRDARTGQVNYQNLMSFKTAIEEGNFLNPDSRTFWGEQEKQIVKTQKQQKLSNMVAKGIYTPTWMVQHTYGQNNVKADLEVVKIPFSAITEEVEVSDADISTYIKNNASTYTIAEETRTGEYLVIDINASENDEQGLLAEFATTIEGFKGATNDSLFAITNQGAANNYYFKKSELPDSLQNNIASLEVGDIYGPYRENELGYTATKIVDAKIVPDSVKARHILRSADSANPSSLIQATLTIDSLKRELEAGRGNFDELARSLSQDPGSAAKGGDLGYFVQSTMVPGFKDACFYYGKEGGYYKVQTQFGVHLIHVQDQKFLDNELKYKTASITKLVVPSEATIQAAMDKASDLASENRDLASLTTAIEADESLSLETSAAFKVNDFNFSPLGGGNTGRDMVRWLFDEDVDTGDLSPELYEFQNPQTGYLNKVVLLGLKEVLPSGLPTGVTARNLVEELVVNQKKGEMLKAKVSTSDLSALASQYGTTVETISGYSLSDAFNPILGRESEVSGIAVNQAANTTSAPIIGNDGVYVVKTNAKSASPAPTNIPQLRSSSSQTMRGSVNFGLIEALKNGAEVEDNRFKVGM